jgi:D-glycero-D-manno-heptose 1,7-bisphosphate phosphatase
MKAELARERVDVEGIFFCPHTPWAGCGCRKPEPGLVRQAARELDLDLSKSYLVGDRESDVEAGERAGVKEAFRVERDRGPSEAVDAILCEG